MPVPVVTIEQMRRWEQATWATGGAEREVIEQVGRLVALRARELTRPQDRILILAGKGHNGDDARCARPHLEDRRAELLEIQDPAAALGLVEQGLARAPDLIIDGLFGIGLNRPLDAAWTRLIDTINRARRRVLAVDVPSGLQAETGEVLGAAIQAERTLTLAAPKVGLLRTEAAAHVGRLEVAPEIGLAPCPFDGELQWVLPGDFAGCPPTRPVVSHKGSYGHAAILAGWPGYHGAAVLAARGAQRAQPGLITLLVEREIYAPVAAQLQAVMVRALAGAVELPEGATGILVGPGLAGPAAAERFRAALTTLWRGERAPLVVDASALEWLTSGPGKSEALRVITPHPGEAARLLRTNAEKLQSDRLGALRRLSAIYGDAWVVLKGHQTLVGRSEGPVWVNSSGNPHLAQGGSGDILAGFLVGLLAQPERQTDPGRTIAQAVWQHGAAADALTTRRRNWIPEDLIESIGDAA
ncbi:MAG: NAD(P)H-hydrate dehydratase [Verrucomicrobiales bacterium]|nr:NAD(P)H-hydrate dehydratase [Verrucomicrobiales bacterium]